MVNIAIASGCFRPKVAMTTQFSPSRLIRADDAPTQLESSGPPSNSAYHFTSFHKEIASILMSVPNYDFLLFPSETERYGPIQYHVYLGRQIGVRSPDHDKPSVTWRYIVIGKIAANEDSVKRSLE